MGFLENILKPAAAEPSLRSRTCYTFASEATWESHDEPAASMILEEGLYLGSKENAMDPEQLKEFEITHPLSLIGPVRTAIDEVERSHVKVSDYGDTDLVGPDGVLAKLEGVIDEGMHGDNRILIHCKQGQNRSAAICIAYLMRKGRTLSEAHTLVKDRRPEIGMHDKY